MTDIALSSGDYVRPYRSPWGAFPTRGFKLSTGNSSLAMFVGSVVALDAGSTSFRDCIVKPALTSGTITSTQIVGICAENPNAPLASTNVQGTIVAVWEANPQVEFRARTRGGLLNSTLVGEVRELMRDTTLNIELVNLAASCLATPINPVIITGLIDNSGDSGGAVTFRFRQAAGVLAFYH